MKNAYGTNGNSTRCWLWKKWRVTVNHQQSQVLAHVQQQQQEILSMTSSWSKDKSYLMVFFFQYLRSKTTTCCELLQSSKLRHKIPNFTGIWTFFLYSLHSLLGKSILTKTLVLLWVVDTDTQTLSEILLMEAAERAGCFQAMNVGSDELMDI